MTSESVDVSHPSPSQEPAAARRSGLEEALKDPRFAEVADLMLCAVGVSKHDPAAGAVVYVGPEKATASA